MSVNLNVKNVAKQFVMHLQDGIRLPVVDNVDFDVPAGQCVVLGGPSGVGKSSILKMIYGNYRIDQGEINIKHNGEMVDIATVDPRKVLEVRKTSLGYISQFLRVIPRVGTFDLVVQAAVFQGVEQGRAESRARELLTLLNVSPSMWALPPATFSGGEQQRVNIARGMVGDYSTLLMDEPTASLDGANRQIVVNLIREKKAAGVAILGIFHDEEVRELVADHIIDVSKFKPKMAA